MPYNPTGARTYTLASSISSTQNTITLSSFLEPVSNTPYTMAMLNTDIVYFTIAPKTSQTEFGSFMGITQNADGTATLTGVVRGLSRSWPFTSQATFKLPHGGQTNFILSNSPEQLLEYGTLRNDESITGFWTAPDPIVAQGVATKAYVLSVVNGGSVTLAALTVPGTAGESLTAGDLAYFKVADGKWYRTTGLTEATLFGIQLGIVQSTTAINVAIASGVLLRGIDTHNTGTAGTLAYASDTAGAISGTTGTVTKVVGQYVINLGGVYFNPEFYDILTPSDKSALLVASFPTKVEVFRGAGVFTVTIATPAVFTLANHNFSINTPVVFSTTGALPTGLTAGTTYYVISAGFTLSAFQVSATLGGSAVNTTGSQSGVHTASYVWTKATNAKSIQIIAIGAGGSGAGGLSGGGSSNTGAGGGGGGAVNRTMNATDVPSTLTVSPGIGGAVTTAGLAGLSGTASTFGTLVNAGGGAGGGITGAAIGGGGGSVISNATGRLGGVPTATTNGIGGQGPSTPNTTATGPGSNGEWGGGSGSNQAEPANGGGSSIYGGGGGGSGGQFSVGTEAGSPGGKSGSYVIGGGGTGGAASGGNGGNGADNSGGLGYGGAGGGGGGGGDPIPGHGGDGGFPGGGGGGGANTTSSATNTVGGRGGGGQLTVITYF